MTTSNEKKKNALSVHACMQNITANSIHKTYYWVHMQLHDKHLEFGMEFAYSKHIEYCNISNELKVKFGRFLHVST